MIDQSASKASNVNKDNLTVLPVKILIQVIGKPPAFDYLAIAHTNKVRISKTAKGKYLLEV